MTILVITTDKMIRIVMVHRIAQLRMKLKKVSKIKIKIKLKTDKEKISKDWLKKMSYSKLLFKKTKKLKV